MGTDIVASDWNNRIRDAMIGLAKKIPEVGSVVSVLIGLFWPTDKVNIFEALKADLKKLVKEEILEYELNLSQSQIDGLQSIIQRYKEAKNHEKGSLLDIWITRADELSIQFRESTNNIHLILLVINMSVLHLAGLRERLDFGKELYNEDNTEQWQKDLEDMYSTYIVDFLPKIFKQWQLWRADQVQIKTWTEKHPTTLPPFFRPDSHATTEDTLTGEKKSFSVEFKDSLEVFKDICNAHKTRMCNDAISDMAGCIATTFEYYTILPENSKNFPKYDKDVFGRMFKGPYSNDLSYAELDYGVGKPVPNFRLHPDNDDYSPDSGPITKIVIRSWDIIDAMQFIYANREGKLAGNANGGAEHEFDVTNKPINGFELGFGSGVLVSVKIIYYDDTLSSTNATHGTSSSTYGATSSIKGPPVYKLSSWSFKVDSGPSNTYGPSVVQFEYVPQIE